MGEKSYLIYQVKKLAAELGRTPTQEEFIPKIGSRYYITKHFGTFNKLLEVAGLEVNKEGVGRHG